MYLVSCIHWTNKYSSIYGDVALMPYMLCSGEIAFIIIIQVALGAFSSGIVRSKLCFGFRLIADFFCIETSMTKFTPNVHFG